MLTPSMGVGILPRRYLEELQDGKLIPTPGTRMMPRVFILKEPGAYIDGVLVGEGSGVEVNDQNTGEVVSCKTWDIEIGGGVILALKGSHQIDRQLPTVVGKRVKVTLLGQVDTNKGRRVKDFLVEVYEAGGPAIVPEAA
jgi:hypothetical protein